MLVSPEKVLRKYCGPVTVVVAEPSVTVVQAESAKLKIVQSPETEPEIIFHSAFFSMGL